MASASGAEPRPHIIQWLIDTRPLWPVPKKEKTKDEVQELEIAASRALALLTPAEQESVLKFFHVRDAKMKLASYLLKHLVITKYCNVSWSESTISLGTNGKPCFIPSSNCQSHVNIDFNVSHQAGIVSLIAAIGFEGNVDVGSDVVCADERLSKDYENIEKDGFFEWVDMHADVFADSECSFMKLGSLSEKEVGLEGVKISGFGRDALSRCQRRNTKVHVKVTKEDGTEARVEIDSNMAIDAKLRRFYAMWCLRETYVKMTGEALLASWLKELEILDVQTPAAKELIQDSASLEKGDTAQNFRIVFKNRPVTDVTMELSALGLAYMVGGAVRASNAAERPQTSMGKWQEINLERDILEFAESKI
ncbi:hypothetical protein BGZ60DRAFT_377398 [Tricladium varicosporioides]|nr:hypothetical protein BGZ60DRAFT_377398 [Hymenoscyphus varicosporioides]